MKTNVRIKENKQQTTKVREQNKEKAKAIHYSCTLQEWFLSVLELCKVGRKQNNRFLSEIVAEIVSFLDSVRTVVPNRRQRGGANTKVVFVWAVGHTGIRILSELTAIMRSENKAVGCKEKDPLTANGWSVAIQLEARELVLFLWR